MPWCSFPHSTVLSPLPSAVLLPAPHCTWIDTIADQPAKATAVLSASLPLKRNACHDHPIALALIPIVLLIGLGHAMKHRVFLNDSFWVQAERLSYFVLLPTLFLHSLATADLTGVPILGLVSALIISTLVVAGLLIVSSRFITTDGPTFTSVFQGGIRFNNYVGVTAAVGLFGTHAVALAAVANAAIVPTVNILCVLVFTHYGTARPTFHGILRVATPTTIVIE